MSLTAGSYIITTKDGGFPVGRLLAEDRSLLPKKVVTLTPGIEDPEWGISKAADGNYILRIRGAPTAVINHLLFAILVDEPQPEPWKIEAQPQHGKNIYTIVSAKNPVEGWVVTKTEPETQIAVRPLIVAPSLPPRFPSNELFVITRADD